MKYYMQKKNKQRNFSFEEFQKKFDSAIEENLNTHLALSAFFNLVKEIKQTFSRKQIEQKKADAAKLQFERMQNILGLKVFKKFQMKKKIKSIK